jgi:hypothetical protein
MGCASETDTEDVMGPLGLNYLSLYCHSEGYEGLVLTSYLLLSIYFIYLCKTPGFTLPFLRDLSPVGHTADTYFSPTLGSICEKVPSSLLYIVSDYLPQLKVPYQVAGVTFLAMGNVETLFFLDLISSSFTN